MDVYRTLKVYTGGICRTITFGEATTETEFRDIYHLRYIVYSKKEYIDKDKYKDNLEKDIYDENGSCHYFIAKTDNKLIGVIRIITSDPLPTEKSFSFVEPKEILNIPRSRRAELGRFIIVPPDKENGIYFPRGLVMLFLLDTLSSFGLKNKILGGYAFVKKSLERKMEKRGLPFGKISTYHQIYPRDGVLYSYFTQKDDPVVPIYFLTQKFLDYSENRIRNSFMFKNINGCDYVLRNNIYTTFLKYLRII